MRYPADPPTIEEIVTVMRSAGDGVHGRRLRGLIVVLWRAGLRICEALALAEADLDARRGSLLVRRGKGGRRREVGIDDWAFEQLSPWLDVRVKLPVGPLFCVVTGATRGRPWAAAAARTELRRVASDAGVPSWPCRVAHHVTVYYAFACYTDRPEKGLECLSIQSGSRTFRPRWQTRVARSPRRSGTTCPGSTATSGTS
jgi:site-specific recombinase XerC